MRLATTLAIAAITLFISETAMPAVTPPAAAKKPKVMEKFGDRRVDDYFWLRDKANPEVIDYLKAENAYTDAYMKPLEAFRENLYKEMLARIKETDESVPYRKRGYWYYTREVEGKQYPIYCRRKGSMEAPEEVILDVNALAEGKKFTQVSSLEVSPDGGMLAYTVDFTGFRQYTAYFKNLATGKLLEDKLERVDAMAWSADGKNIFYVIEDDAKRPYRLLRHALGQANDALVYEEKDELYNLGVADTRDEAWIVATSVSKDTSEVRVLRSNDPMGKFQVVEKRRNGHEYYLDSHGDEFYFRSNDKGRNFRVAKAPVADPGQRNWKEVLPHRKLVMLDDIDTFKDFWVVTERDKGLKRLRIFDFATGADHYIAFDEAVYSANATSNAEYDTDKLRFAYQSLVTPRSTFDYEIAKRSRTLLKQQPVLGGYKPEEYQSEALTATAKDGTKVPISLVYKKSLRKGGPQPLLLYGYGSYGIPMDVYFRSSRLSLLDRGVVFAIAHIRGGGDLGKLWYDDGKLLRKMNTFTDFVASAEYLIENGWTTPDKLAIQGGSAGGLLMGAVVNMRPELFKLVVTQVPFVDVMSTMLDATLPLTVPEYLEWGNPNVKKYYDYMRSYSPYDNLAKRSYPAMLVETSLNDSQVMYWEPAKYVAKLRTLKTDANPLLLKTVMEAGHGGASGRYDALKELSLTYTFVLDQLGLAK
jgi:oligopeptidase B